jgi:hypothetical protein
MITEKTTTAPTKAASARIAGAPPAGDPRSQRKNRSGMKVEGRPPDIGPRSNTGPSIAEPRDGGLQAEMHPRRDPWPPGSTTMKKA